MFFGHGRRQLSEEYGMKVYLCPDHHRGPMGPHRNRSFDLYLKRMCQTKFEETHTRDEFMRLFRRNYL